MSRIAGAVFEGQTWNAAKAINPNAQSQRDEIERLMDLYLQQGGEIKQVDISERTNYCPVKAALARRRKK